MRDLSLATKQPNSIPRESVPGTEEKFRLGARDTMPFILLKIQLCICERDFQVMLGTTRSFHLAQRPSSVSHVSRVNYEYQVIF